MGVPISPSDTHDLAVIGAGPAGLAAAVTAAGFGLRVALVDAAARPGGQFYRQPAPGLGAARPEALHHSWGAFARRAARLGEQITAGRVQHFPEHHVWSVTRDDAHWTVHAVAGPDGAQGRTEVTARTVLLATGAHERQLPFPGWTLPGVVGAGGAQAMLKAGLVLPGRRIVVAGSGPLLLAVAGSLAAAGATVPVVVEASGYACYARAPRTLAANPRKLAEGAGHTATLLRHGVRIRFRSAITAVHGTDRVEAVTLTRLDRNWSPLVGTGLRIPCDALAVGHGLVPQLELATGLGCATRRTPDGTCALVLDDRQRTTVDGVWAAGETGGVGGAELAFLEGELAAHDIAQQDPRAVRCGGVVTGCAGSPGPWPPPMRRAPAGPAGCVRTPTSAAARRSRPGGSRKPSPVSAPATPAPSNSSPGPEWAGVRAGCAPPPSPAWQGRTDPRPTADRLPAPLPWGNSPANRGSSASGDLGKPQDTQ